jgi:hypothetical protein
MTIVGRVAPGTQSPPNLADRIAVHKPWTSKNQARAMVCGFRGNRKKFLIKPAAYALSRDR